MVKIQFDLPGRVAIRVGGFTLAVRLVRPNASPYSIGRQASLQRLHLKAGLLSRIHVLVTV